MLMFRIRKIRRWHRHQNWTMTVQVKVIKLALFASKLLTYFRSANVIIQFVMNVQQVNLQLNYLRFENEFDNIDWLIDDAISGMRVLCKQNECPICRRINQKVIFTSEILPYKELELKNRSCLYDKQYRICFTGQRAQNAFRRLLEHSCNK